jgi:O-antigen/teichoic acid export membrane protein
MGTPTESKAVGQGALLFTDQMILAMANWIYWLVISKLTGASEIGHATIIYSLVLLIVTLSELGLEYPILKKSYAQRSIPATTLMIELGIILASLPFVLYLANYNLYYGSLKEFTWIVIAMLVTSSIGFITKYTLLGISEAKNVLIFDVLATATKFVTGLALVSLGLGALGILLSFLMSSFVLATGTLVVVARSFNLMPSWDIKFFKETIKDALVNTPNKLARTLILSLGIVMLASFGVANSDIGSYYLILMISIVAGGFASSIALTAIPASSVSRIDLSSQALRISLSLTAPIVSALIIGRQSALSIIGEQYVQAETVLIVLAISILPSSIVINAISKFNYFAQSRKLILIAGAQILVFIVSFFLLVPSYGVLGAAYCTLLSYTVASILAVIWSERILIRYICIAGLAIVAGCISGYAVTLLLEHGVIQAFLSIAFSIAASTGVVFALKNISLRELKYLIGVSIRNAKQ